MEIEIGSQEALLRLLRLNLTTLVCIQEVLLTLEGQGHLRQAVTLVKRQGRLKIGLTQVLLQAQEVLGGMSILKPSTTPRSDSKDVPQIQIVLTAVKQPIPKLIGT